MTHVYIRTELYLIYKYNGADIYDIILYITLLCGGKYAYVQRQYVNIQVNQLSVSTAVVTGAVLVNLSYFQEHIVTY